MSVLVPLSIRMIVVLGGTGEDVCLFLSHVLRGAGGSEEERQRDREREMFAFANMSTAQTTAAAPRAPRLEQRRVHECIVTCRFVM